MNTYALARHYFGELSHIPRLPLHEEKIRNWIISWAEEKKWTHETDTIGNLLVIAPGESTKTLCLQSHMDMVCVADGKHNFDINGISLVEEDGVMKGKKTSLGADNGIGVAVMMALAELEHRPALELLFTVGEEVGLIGAQHIGLSIQAPIALNLDWSDSETIGTGCGGTLLLKGSKDLSKIPYQTFSKCEDIFQITLHGMQGGHSGEDIRHYRGNALIEILKVFQEIKGITDIGDISGGEADNAIPHSAKIMIKYSGHPNLLKNELSHVQKVLRTKYKYETISLNAETIQKPVNLFEKKDILSLLSEIIEVGTGVQVWGKHNTPLSSWNLGILTLDHANLSVSYFLRTNQEDGIEPMKNDIMTGLSETLWTMSHESPPWNHSSQSDFIEHIQASFCDAENITLPLLTIHAAVECGILSKKYPQTEWVSVGATISNMHTTRESIRIRDFEEFVERVEKLITHYVENQTRD